MQITFGRVRRRTSPTNLGDRGPYFSYSKIEKYVDTLENNNPPSLAGFVTPPFR